VKAALLDAYSQPLGINGPEVIEPAQSLDLNRHAINLPFSMMARSYRASVTLVSPEGFTPTFFGSARAIREVGKRHPGVVQRKGPGSLRGPSFRRSTYWRDASIRLNSDAA
jgi:hypothetical protein